MVSSFIFISFISALILLRISSITSSVLKMYSKDTSEDLVTRATIGQTEIRQHTTKPKRVTMKILLLQKRFLGFVPSCNLGDTTKASVT